MSAPLFDTGAPKRGGGMFTDWSQEPGMCIAVPSAEDAPKEFRKSLRRIERANTAEELDGVIARENEMARAFLFGNFYEFAFEIWDRLEARRQGFADQAAWEEAHAAAERTLAAKAAGNVGSARHSASCETARNAENARNWNDVF